MTQVHKEQLNQVENAIAGRGGLDIEIFGMEGVPPEIIDQHNQQVTQQHFADERARQQATGNPTRGSGLNGTANKRAKKNETLEEIQERAEKYRVDRANGVLPPPVAEAKLEPVSCRIAIFQSIGVLLTYAKDSTSCPALCTTSRRRTIRPGPVPARCSSLCATRQHTRRFRTSTTPGFQRTATRFSYEWRTAWRRLQCLA